MVTLGPKEQIMKKTNFEVVRHLSIRYLILGGKGGRLKAAYPYPPRDKLGLGVNSPLHPAPILKERAWNR